MYKCTAAPFFLLACRTKLPVKIKNTIILCAVLASTLPPILLWYEMSHTKNYVMETQEQDSEGFISSRSLNFTSLPTTSISGDMYVTLLIPPKPSLSPVNYQPSVSTDCSTVHVAMVASGDIGSRYLYTTIKSVLIHRSTPLYFHFITDDRAKTVLHTMMSTWLVPAISHDYYDLSQALTNVKLGSTDSDIQCSRSLSVHLNLDLVLPNTIQHVIVIEPASVVTLDLAQLWALTKSRLNGSITVCQSKCIVYCSEGSDIELTGWGAIGLCLQNMRKENNIPKHNNCKPSVADIADKAMMKFFNSGSNMGQLCRTALEYDGELFRYRKMGKCLRGLQPLVRKAPSKKDECKLFEWERKAHRRELPFLLGHSYKSSGEYDVTLTTHLDYNRLSLLERILETWDGPASVAIHLSDYQVEGVVSFLLNSKSLQHRLNVTYHLLFIVGPSYPPNHARELAHRFVSTPFMFILDVDFISSLCLYDILKKKLKANVFENMDKKAIVVPAFESDNTNFIVPHRKSEMIGLYERGTVRQFHLNVFKKGHDSTDYQKWISATNTYSVTWKDLYEPYYLLKTSVISFDHRFVARFCDKSSHSIELHMAGYEFIVFPDAFVVHLPHRKSTQNMYRLKKCNNEWYKNWIEEKRTQYNYTNNDVKNVC
jgi:hypothetical protein